MRDEPYPPIVGDWYRNLKGEIFEVVALDEGDGTVSFQYFDGSLEATDLDSWFELSIEPVEPPEDWSGPLDIEREDYGVEFEETPSPNGHHQALDQFE